MNHTLYKSDDNHCSAERSRIQPYTSSFFSSRLIPSHFSSHPSFYHFVFFFFTYQPSVARGELPLLPHSHFHHPSSACQTKTCPPAPQRYLLTSILVWYYCSPSHLCSLTLFLPFSFFNASPRIDLTKCRALLLPCGDGHLTDPVSGSMSLQTQWGRDEGR